MVRLKKRIRVNINAKVAAVFLKNKKTVAENQEKNFAIAVPANPRRIAVKTKKKPQSKLWFFLNFNSFKSNAARH